MGKSSGGGGGLNSASGAWDRAFGTTKSHKLGREGQENATRQYKDSQSVFNKMDNADSAYRTAFNEPYERMRSRLGALHDEAFQQSNDARKTYTNDIQPRLKNVMEDAQKEASGAMTLQEAGDPNNAVHQKVRAMYDQQGANVRRQGLADFGVLSGLGAQAAQGAMGAPMTTGQQANIYAANQSQAGNAYSAAQRRVFDLQQQGIDRGFEESDRQYQRGQGAKDRYRNSIADVSGAEADYQSRMRDFRGERLGLSGAQMDLDNQRAALDRDIAYGQGERQLGAIGNYYGTQNQILGNRMNDNAARQQGQMGILSSIIGAGAQMYGKSGGKAS